MFQRNYMEKVLDEYKKTVDCKEREYIYELLHKATYSSESGNVNVYVETEDMANKIDDILWGEIGDYLLDYEIYPDEDGEWDVDCMFGGNFVPNWNGFERG